MATIIILTPPPPPGGNGLDSRAAPERCEYVAWEVSDETASLIECIANHQEKPKR